MDNSDKEYLCQMRCNNNTGIAVSICNECPGVNVCEWSDRKYKAKKGYKSIRIACKKEWYSKYFNTLEEKNSEEMNEVQKVDSFMLLQNVHRCKEAVSKATFEYQNALQAYINFCANIRKVSE